MIRISISLQEFIFAALFCASLSQSNVTVETPSGRLEGLLITFNGTNIMMFLGIPYAKPPVDELRFKKPVPIEAWNGIRKAKQFGPGCMQYTQQPAPWRDDMPGLSEDCLYLNIWAPYDSNNERKKSVMFWIHTGGFISSSSRVDYFNGEALAALGSVIVVTINHRLGAQGFMYSDTEDAPGNMGELDIVESLKWVNKNIESFGGDKNSITVFGHSAGGFSTGLLCISPLTKGLFQRAILQSGSPYNLNGKDNDLDFHTTQKIAELVGCADSENSLQDDPKKVMTCLNDTDPFQLTMALANASQNAQNGRPVYPRYNDSFLSEYPLKRFREGNMHQLDILIGDVNGDGALILVTSNLNVFGYFGEKDPKINLTFGETLIRNYFKNYSDTDAIVKQYLGGLKEDEYYKIREQVFLSMGDFERTCPSVYFAETYAKKYKNVYFFRFTHHSSNAPWAPWMLSSHFEEVPYVFGHPLRYPQNYTEEEIILSQRMISYWSSFAKTGNPTPVDMPLSKEGSTCSKENCRSGKWPLYSEKDPRYKVLNTDEFKTELAPRKKYCDFFRPYFGL